LKYFQKINLSFRQPPSENLFLPFWANVFYWIQINLQAESLTLALFGKKKFLSEIRPLPPNFAYKKIKIFCQNFANRTSAPLNLSIGFISDLFNEILRRLPKIIFLFLHPCPPFGVKLNR
jgi:hypothetical protein